ncbi:RipA family octameric membrane protein [Sphaerotilus montanus]|uniref:RipA family octameric membrane protein n=1 Tax=Sphaerotilus montanus TaxID=522889 RepID=UPI003FA1DBED
MTKDEYIGKFSGTVTGSQKERAEKALDLALDIRKFEIELYWKRATYFWTFIAAALAGYAVVYKDGESNSNAWLSLLFSSLGLTFSTAWYLVNRGSKFWQNNWERHVDLLEYDLRKRNFQSFLCF